MRSDSSRETTAGKTSPEAPGTSEELAAPSASGTGRETSPPMPLNRNLVLGGTALALLILAYFFGWWNGRAQAAAIRSDYEQRLQTAQKETEGLRAELASTQTLNRLVLARGWLYRAAVALDRRNFGTANDYVRQAAETLQAIAPVEMSANAAALTRAREAVSSLNIQVAVDLEQQRRQLLDAAAQLEALMPR